MSESKTVGVDWIKGKIMNNMISYSITFLLHCELQMILVHLFSLKSI